MFKYDESRFILHSIEGNGLSFAHLFIKSERIYAVIKLDIMPGNSKIAIKPILEWEDKKLVSSTPLLEISFGDILYESALTKANEFVENLGVDEMYNDEEERNICIHNSDYEINFVIRITKDEINIVVDDTSIGIESGFVKRYHMSSLLKADVIDHLAVIATINNEQYSLEELVTV